MEENEIKIGTQTWTSKNLDVETYRNGDEIPQVKDKEEWANLSTGAWCYYENDTANGTTYGKLYNWYAVNDPRGLAPKGYHIPTDAEWTILTENLGGTFRLTASGATSYTWLPGDEGGKKMKSTSGWNNHANGTNTSGFAGLPGGYRDCDGDFYSIGATESKYSDGFWWSSSENYAYFAWSRYLSANDGGVYRSFYNKHYGFSVRCLRD